MCGICLVFSSNWKVDFVPATLCISSLQRLQHRGRQMAKVVTDLEEMGGIGTVDQIFGYSDKKTLRGSLCIGHTRYTTSPRLNCLTQNTSQPFDIDTPFSERLIIAHNGQLGGPPEEFRKIIETLKEKKFVFRFGTDTEIFLAYYCTSKCETAKERVLDAFQKVTGSATIVGVIIHGSKKFFFGGRNNGNRPLFVGKDVNSIIFTSEDYMYAGWDIKNVKEVSPGSFLWFEEGKEEPDEVKFFCPNPRYCIFELFYFSHPLSTFKGHTISTFRKSFGAELSKEHPSISNKNWDVIMGVPDSGNHCALEFSKASSIPFDFGIIRNHFSNQRSFIVENY